MYYYMFSNKTPTKKHHACLFTRFHQLKIVKSRTQLSSTTSTSNQQNPLTHTRVLQLQYKATKGRFKFILTYLTSRGVPKNSIHQPMMHNSSSLVLVFDNSNRTMCVIYHMVANAPHDSPANQATLVLSIKYETLKWLGNNN